MYNTIAEIYAYIQILRNQIQELQNTLINHQQATTELINQQSTLLYIILGLLALVTVLMIVSILNQRKLKKELRQLRELIEAKAAQADGEEDKGNT